MTSDRLREILEALHWSQRDLADLAGCNERYARRWASGELEIPSVLAEWIEQRLRMHAAHPVPDWRRRRGV